MKNDAYLIKHIAIRASDMYERLADRHVPWGYIAAEITIVHTEVCRLRLQDFHDADDGNFAHDIGGIHEHLSLDGEPHLTRGFCPRFADPAAFGKPEPVAL